jgi:ribosome biogenesis GTPase
VVDLLPRGPSLLRQEAGPGGGSQCLAANLEVVLLVMGLDRNFNPPRMERLAALAWGSGAQPVAVLTKGDLCGDPEGFARLIQGVAPGVPVLTVAAPRGEGLEELRAWLPPGRTGAMAGSSGAGKSTLLNALMGQEVRRTQETRALDGRGRHTTSLRELFLLPGGGCLIDTPGIREVGLCAEGSDLDSAFADIAALAAGCRFRDCAHGAEPGCAVQAALAEGLLDPDRYGRYLRLRREVAFEAARADEHLWREREEKWHRISRLQKQFRKR